MLQSYCWPRSSLHSSSVELPVHKGACNLLNSRIFYCMPHISCPMRSIHSLWTIFRGSRTVQCLINYSFLAHFWLRPGLRNKGHFVCTWTSFIFRPWNFPGPISRPRFINDFPAFVLAFLFFSEPNGLFYYCMISLEGIAQFRFIVRFFCKHVFLAIKYAEVLISSKHFANFCFDNCKIDEEHFFEFWNWRSSYSLP